MTQSNVTVAGSLFSSLSFSTEFFFPCKVYIFKAMYCHRTESVDCVTVCQFKDCS